MSIDSVIELKKIAIYGKPNVTFAVTGGIGSGKSTLAQFWADTGALVVNADTLAREVVEPGTIGLQMVVQEFGEQILEKDGTMNRAVMAQLVFSDAEKRLRLEEILHPLIEQKATEHFSMRKHGQLGIYDVPLLTPESNLDKYDGIIVVESLDELRLKRLEKRGLSRQESVKRISAQISDEARRELAHIVVRNDGTYEDLALAAEYITDEYIKL